MKRTSILAIGFGMLLGVGLLTPGCGDSGSDSKKDGSLDAKKDALSTGGAKGTGGAVGSGGARATGGSSGSGGVLGTGGSAGAPGTGGAQGSGGATTPVDAGRDGAPDGRPDTLADTRGTDSRDVSITDPETGADTRAPRLDVGSQDVSLDQAGVDSRVLLDTSVDQGTVDAEEIDTSALDSSEG
jgi:hypothetical protein